MHFKKGILLTTMMILLTQSVAHVIMKSPSPFKKFLLQTSPLGTGFPFPCQKGSEADMYTSDYSENNWLAGGSQVIEFTGSAVHGGGSCQFSLATGDIPPSDYSKWKVIHSVIGDCPAKARMNLDTITHNSNAVPDGHHCTAQGESECVKSYTIGIPKELKTGRYTFAWTWFNKIGNREMYMNCAPVHVEGGSHSKDDFLDSLPPIFFANINDKPCKTSNGVLDIPNPGVSFQRDAAAYPDSLGTCKASSVPGHQLLANASISPIIAQLTVPTNSASLQEAVNLDDHPILANLPLGNCAYPCSPDGSLICIDKVHFGLCDHGCVVSQNVAAGTSCIDGAIVKLV